VAKRYERCSVAPASVEVTLKYAARLMGVTSMLGLVQIFGVIYSGPSCGEYTGNRMHKTITLEALGAEKSRGAEGERPLNTGPVAGVARPELYQRERYYTDAAMTRGTGENVGNRQRAAR
jgi:hypothetical protein